MDILHDDGEKGEFYIEEGGERQARLQYFHSRAGEINIYHTEVTEELAGRGVGKQLVKAAVEYARANALKIIASCPFASKILGATPEYRDVLSAGDQK